MVVCIALPRFALAVAAGGREALAAGPVALAPEPGREPVIGEVSAVAEAKGVRPGLRLGEALARCPTLRLVAPDPAGVADAWEDVLVRLESIGASVEPGAAGIAWFSANGLRRLHGGDLEGVLTATRRVLGACPRRGAAPSCFGAYASDGAAPSRPGELGTPARIGAAPSRFAAPSRPEELGTPARIGAAPSRFAALAAARRARSRRPEVAPAAPEALAAYLAPLPVSLLALRPDVAHMPEPLERLGVGTLGRLAGLSSAALADRFGPAGQLARELALGRDTPLRPRHPAERLEEALELPESASGPQLERALGLLIDRLLARRERRGRTLRSVVVSAVLVEGGTWRTKLTFREALADPRRMRLTLVPRLAELPAPADALRLRVEAFGPPAADQRSLLSAAAVVRAARLREAVRQARAAAGPDAALRIIPVDPDSRVPERRHALAPWDP